MNAGPILERLRRSRFRARFSLSRKDCEYIDERGLDAVRMHAREFIRTRLAPASIPNDGKQTPMRGHPVFAAQHACACCCRGCLEKWHRIPAGTELSGEQQEFVVSLLMCWIERQYAAHPLPHEKSRDTGRPVLPGLERSPS